VQVDFTPCRLGLSDYVTQSKYWTKGKEWVLDVARNTEEKQDLIEKSKSGTQEQGRASQYTGALVRKELKKWSMQFA
jgi:hypothetical protein